ncbi:hypothetical protein SLNWT_1169 [Streptomyces albus]|uniref:Uncharacterized protein n=1 Tax=Streptomyces albus (strain ATCC 21838 / DSM 41398 / FERM P-419 / JCM 4703 / NBRC 107858) TaxID=1081613 RepID=A0A0B5EQH2_STRA4|nr:hypothetical protein SLNWT_1169 [Streptomyces albus]AOU75860.1 hypothetical protein SLNHY_1169 [Streptomyces albus]AYN31666.1 hypothetical protein DUI70_1164 [Streptomyces albus]
MDLREPCGCGVMSGPRQRPGTVGRRLAGPHRGEGERCRAGAGSRRSEPAWRPDRRAAPARPSARGPKR